MTAIIIGISSSLLLILIFAFLKQFEKSIIYGLTLSAIGFLYVGFTWSNFSELILTAIQALVFLMIAYYGIKRNILFLAVGFFAHGIWDLAYTHFQSSTLIPPHYDLFCLTFDFIVGIYLVVFAQKKKQQDSNLINL